MKRAYKKCKICLEDKDFTEYSSFINRSGSKTYNSYCKPCHSAKQVRRQKEKLLAAYPSLYTECDDCDFILKRRYNKCYKCGSENLLD